MEPIVRRHAERKSSPSEWILGGNSTTVANSPSQCASEPPFCSTPSNPSISGDEGLALPIQHHKSLRVLISFCVITRQKALPFQWLLLLLSLLTLWKSQELGFRYSQISMAGEVALTKQLSSHKHCTAVSLRSKTALQFPPCFTTQTSTCCCSSCVLTVQPSHSPVHVHHLPIQPSADQPSDQPQGEP